LMGGEVDGESWSVRDRGSLEDGRNPCRMVGTDVVILKGDRGPLPP
jgi:hypothetical protein